MAKKMRTGIEDRVEVVDLGDEESSGQMEERDADSDDKLGLDKKLKNVKGIREKAARDDKAKESPETKGEEPKGRHDADDKEGLDKKKRVLILKEFTQELVKKYGPMIRAIILFGSTARGEFRGESDIDVFIIVDDTRHKITPAMRDRMEFEMTMIAKGLSKQLSVQQPYLLTEFWAMVRIGHPIVFNFIREGVAIYDKDIFTPIKRLLEMGEIKPSEEAVEKYMERGPKRIQRVETAKTYMVVEDCYYAMLETAQAALMFMGKNPPRPAEVCDVLRKTLVKSKLLEERYVRHLGGVIEVRKQVEHKKLRGVTGVQLDLWIKKSKDFIKRMEKVVIRLEVMKREDMVHKSHLVMTETALTLLKAMKKTPKKNESVIKAFDTHLVRPGLVQQQYLDAFSELDRMMKKVRAGKIMDIQKRDIILHREYVRRFIREAGRILKKNIKDDVRD